MLVIGKEEVRELLSMKECIGLMKETLMDLNDGKASMSLRSANKLAGDDFYLLMPAYLNEKGYFGVKLITIFPSNHGRNLPSHQGVVLLFSAEDGKERASIDCISITALRTASVTAVATDLLAKKDAKTMGFLGAGVQARNHVESLLLVRDIEEIKVWDLYPSAAEKFADEMSEKYNVKVTVCETAEEVVSNSEIITTVTLAKEPVLNGEWLKPGTHINAIGASAKAYREIDSSAVAKARLYVDKKESCTGESSDYLVPLSEGAIEDDHIVAEIGDILLNKAEGRKTDTEITMFEGMGLAVEDIASAAYIYQKAAKKKL
jgi:ornithine cyclodeaminase